VSNNVGIDFTELGPPMAANQVVLHRPRMAATQGVRHKGCRRWKTRRRPDNNRISGQAEGKGNHSGLC